jgi:gliding motility-associated-like protein
MKKTCLASDRKSIFLASKNKNYNILRPFAKCFLLAIGIVLFSLNVHAQFTATWTLLSSAAKTGVTGDVQAAAVTAGPMVPGINFPNPGSHNTDGYRCQIPSGNWPNVATDGYHLDFPLSAVGSYDLNITGLTFTAKTSGGSGNSMASLAYQAEGTATWTPFGTAQTLPSGGTNNITFTGLATSLPTGVNYIIRLYIYAAGATTTSSRSVYIRNVVFSGNAIPAGPAPTVLTTAASATGTSTGSASGDITSAGSWPVTTSGFVWSLASDPTIDLPTKTIDGPTSGAFTGTITGLTASTSYHVRAYATSLIGTSYGADLSFTTAAPVKPTVTTLAVVVTSPVTATGGGNITDDGGDPVTRRGVAWNTTGTPVIPANSSTTDGTGSGSYSSFLSGLTASTNYFVRAYAINGVDTAYGNEVTFTTPAPTPSIVVVPDSLGFGTILQGTTSTSQTYTVSGYFLTPAAGDITITAPPGYRISTSAGSGFAGLLNLPYTGNTLATTTIYVTFSPTALANYNKLITNAGGGAPTKNVIVTGSIDPVGGQGQTGFSNRGTDFWTGFGPHEKITTADGSNANAIMTLYFSSDLASVVTIYVGSTLVETINLPANTITASSVLPWTGTEDARLIDEGVIAGKGIYIHSTNPMVAYAEISGSKVTAATVLFPVNTLGKSYTALNYTQLSNSGSSNSRSYAFAVATQDNTTVEVTLPAGIISETGLTGTNTRTLNKGDVWLIKGSDNVTDITGTQIKSISTAGSACQPIAVFSGSGKIAITCDGSSASSDNLFQQAFPSVAWGRKYVSAPTGGDNYAGNIYRIMINPDYASTVVTVNGVTLPNAAPIPGITTASTGAPATTIDITNGLYYEFRTNVPIVISATSPVMVAQYITNKTKCSNNFSPDAGDPDMIYLSPVEQTIDKIIVSPIATQNLNSINYINVVIKTADVPNFAIEDQGAAPVPVLFTSIDGTYSYAQILLTPGYSPSVFYKLSSTGGGFNAISYGYSSSESYAYNAGTNLVDLLSGFSVQNQFGTGAAVAACRGSEFFMSITLAFRPVSILWDFQTNTNLSPNTNVTQTGAALLDPQVLVDSVIINGVQLYTYRIPAPYVYNAVDTFNVKVSATSPTPDGCNGVKEYVYPIKVEQGPSADFTFAPGTGCLAPIQFTDASLGNGGTLNAWQWNFGNSPATTSTERNPIFTYTAGGNYNVKLRAISAEGCYDDTTKVVTIPGLPTLTITQVAPLCANGSPVTLVPSLPEGVFTGTGVSGNSFDPSIAGAGTFNIGYSIPTNPCALPGSTQIVVNPVPTGFDAGSQIDAVAGRQVTLQGTGPADYTYVWSPATVANVNSLVTKSTATTPTLYTLTATNSAGCTSTDQVQLNITIDCVVPPQLLTPNNDGYFDKWVVINGTCTRQVKVDVYNRWGGLVYNNDNYNNEWDGTHKGHLLPDATYYYIVKAFLTDGSVLYYKGNVTILR